MKKLQIIILLIILPLSLTQEIDCGEGCGECYERGCYTCFHRYLTTDASGFTSCDSLPAPRSENCVLYMGNHPGTNTGNFCNICSRGYKMKRGICVPSTTSDCVKEIVDPFGNTRCLICEGGVPNSVGKCVEFPSSTIYNHCLWGSNIGGGKSCFKCKPGYVREGNQIMCERNEEFEGCLVTSFIEGNLVCLICDVWNGYSMRDPDSRECERD